MAIQPPPAWVPQVDGYTDLSLLGRGGFAAVYRAQETIFGRAVALKVITTDLDEDAQRRFERECKALGAMAGHENIVTVYGGGKTSDGQPYLVMELLEGGSIGAWLKNHGPVPAADVVSHGIAMAQAIAVAHDAGIVHRDIKPDNILLSRSGVPKLADFGISTISGGYETQSGNLSATLAYAAPEVLTGAAPAAAGDIYALAATLASMLAGTPIFRARSGEHVGSFMQRLMNEPPPELQQFGASQVLEAVLTRGLAKDPADRYSSALQFRDALQSAADANAPFGEIVETIRMRRAVPMPEPQAATSPEEALTIIGSPKPPPPILTPSAQPASDPGRRRLLLAGLAAAAVLASAAGVWAATNSSPQPHNTPLSTNAPNVTCIGFRCTYALTALPAGGRSSWDFGDGSTSTQAASRTTHTYTHAGRYTITVRVEAPGFTASGAPSHTIVLRSAPTTASITAGAPGSMTASANLTARSACGPIHYEIRIGSATGPIVRSSTLTTTPSTVSLPGAGNYVMLTQPATARFVVCPASAPHPFTALPGVASHQPAATAPQPTAPKPQPKPQVGLQPDPP